MAYSILFKQCGSDHMTRGRSRAIDRIDHDQEIVIAYDGKQVHRHAPGVEERHMLGKRILFGEFVENGRPDSVIEHEAISDADDCYFFHTPILASQARKARSDRTVGMKNAKELSHGDTKHRNVRICPRRTGIPTT